MRKLSLYNISHTKILYFLYGLYMLLLQFLPLLRRQNISFGNIKYLVTAFYKKIIRITVVQLHIALHIDFVAYSSVRVQYVNHSVYRTFGIRGTADAAISHIQIAAVK